MSTDTNTPRAWQRCVNNGIIFIEDACREHLQAELQAIQAQLRERTQWQCKCGGTDCAGMAENERLKAEVEAFKANNRYMRGHTAGYAEARDEYGEQLKPLFAKVRELEQDKARLDWLEKSFNDDPIAKVPTWFSVFCDVAQEEPHPAPGQSLRAAIDAARAGKGAT